MTVSTLSTTKLLQCLDAMNLSQYKDTFARELIDGGILLELDEAVLMNELGITSRIHCLRLMRLARGEMSISDLLQTSRAEHR